MPYTNPELINIGKYMFYADIPLFTTSHTNGVLDDMMGKETDSVLTDPQKNIIIEAFEELNTPFLKQMLFRNMRPHRPEPVVETIQEDIGNKTRKEKEARIQAMRYRHAISTKEKEEKKKEYEAALQATDNGKKFLHELITLKERREHRDDTHDAIISTPGKKRKEGGKKKSRKSKKRKKRKKTKKKKNLRKKTKKKKNLRKKR